ncbi:hypothetical protein GFL91_29060 [Rhizobium leguminosarum bv. viciae]|uniref:Uncharacterized protein n=2 Tax=Rhizobium TaxID=379 RepID=A0A8I2H0W0_RHILV|nr:hypothetical protein [Rhizobium laguerreae]NKM48909.1 hypothetical protein [Rhizobium leguminosarum bv. viciae]RUL96379.1 hypothetical protein EEQ99_31270 [Rhizobium anhuiense]
MHIVVCIKQVPDTAQIRVHPVTNTIISHCRRGYARPTLLLCIGLATSHRLVAEFKVPLSSESINWHDDHKDRCDQQSKMRGDYNAIPQRRADPSQSFAVNRNGDPVPKIPARWLCKSPLGEVHRRLPRNSGQPESRIQTSGVGL